MCKNVAVFQICFLLLSSQIWLETRGWITGETRRERLYVSVERGRERVSLAPESGVEG